MLIVLVPNPYSTYKRWLGLSLVTLTEWSTICWSGGNVGELNNGMIKTATPTSFKSENCSNRYHSTWDTVLLLIFYLGQGSVFGFKVFHSAFPTMKFWFLLHRKSMWRLCQLLNMFILISNLLLERWSIAGARTHWVHCEANLGQKWINQLKDVILLSNGVLRSFTFLGVKFQTYI